MALTAKRNNPGAFANKEAVFLKDSLFVFCDQNQFPLINPRVLHATIHIPFRCRYRHAHGPQEE